MYFIKFKDYRPRVARKLSVRNNTIKYTCINQNVTSDWNKTYLTKFKYFLYISPTRYHYKV